MPSDQLSAHPHYDPALPAREAAEYLALHYKTLLALTRARKLAVIRSKGGRLSYRLSDLNAYLDTLREEPRGPKALQEPDWGA